MLSFQPGDKITLTRWAGSEYQGQIFPTGRYLIKAYGGKGGAGTHGIPGGNGGYCYGTLYAYNEKKFDFTIGTAGQMYYPGKCVSPGGGNGGYDSGGYGGWDSWGNREYGGGGGGASSLTIWHGSAYNTGNVLFTVGGGGGGNGWINWSANNYGEAGGTAYNVSGSPTNESSYRGANSWTNNNNIIRQGGGGGGGGDPGGGLKPIYNYDPGGGYGGRSRNPSSYSGDWSWTSTGYGVGYCGGDGYIEVTFVDYIWYSISYSRCVYTITTQREGLSVEASADIGYIDYNPQGQKFLCNASYGIFKDFSYSSIIKDAVLTDDDSHIEFTMPRGNVYVYANFIKYSCNCTRCAIHTEDKVLIPGKIYTIKASGKYNGYPFIDFQMTNVDRKKVHYISRTEFQFVMPEKDVYFTAIYLEDRLNTDIYKPIIEDATMDWEKVLCY